MGRIKLWEETEAERDLDSRVFLHLIVFIEYCVVGTGQGVGSGAMLQTDEISDFVILFIYVCAMQHEDPTSLTRARTCTLCSGSMES